MKSISSDLGQSIQKVEAKRKIARMDRIILVGSGKGGVGKSLVSCAIALSLSKRKLRTAILDVDIHGASVPTYLELSPPLKSSENGLEPELARDGLKVMSLSLFTGNNPIPMRGLEKDSLITDLIALTHWGDLDYLVVDLPPGLGDEVLSSFSLFDKKALLLLVTTPSPIAKDVVLRLRKLAEMERMRVKGVIVNMSYLESGSTRTYPFGRLEKDKMEKELLSPIIGEIPLEPEVSTRGLFHSLDKNGLLSISFEKLADEILD